jgi:hypothetical protein
MTITPYCASKAKFSRTSCIGDVSTFVIDEIGAIPSARLKVNSEGLWPQRTWLWRMLATGSRSGCDRDVAEKYMTAKRRVVCGAVRPCSCHMSWISAGHGDDMGEVSSY